MRVYLEKHRDTTLINDLKLLSDTSWSKYAMDKLKGRYQNFPFFDQEYPLVEELLSKAPSFHAFSDYSIFIINSLKDYLGIDTQTIRSHSLNSRGNKTTINRDLTLEVEGNCYLSGTGAKKYQEESIFTDYGVDILYVHSYDYLKKSMESYPDYYAELSIIDALFSIGRGTVKAIIENYTYGD